MGVERGVVLVEVEMGVIKRQQVRTDAMIMRGPWRWERVF